MLPHAIAPANMHMFGQETREDFAGLNRVTFHTRQSLSRLVRQCFERRAEIYCVCLVHRPPNAQAHQYEGCKISSWSADGTDPMKDAKLSFTIDGFPYAVPVDEITELMVTPCSDPKPAPSAVVQRPSARSAKRKRR